MRSDWLLGDPAPVVDKVRLFCFPYAGGGASLFLPWRRAADSIDVQPVRLPGREGRIRDTPFSRMRDLIDALAEEIPRFAQQAFALFGHSMGALVAYELARRLEVEGLVAEHVFVSGRSAPTVPGEIQRLHDLPTDALTVVLRELSATPSALLEDQETLQVVLPAIRADFELCETYEHESGTIVSSPLTAYFGEQDSWGNRASVAAWKDLTSTSFRLVGFPGGHFFAFRESSDPVLREIELELGANGVAVDVAKRSGADGR